jgi:hypothetical protein
VRAVAVREGDRFKAEALFTLTKKRDAEGAKALLKRATVSYDWAGLSPLQSGVKGVEKDVQAFEMRYSADCNMDKAVELGCAGNVAEALKCAEEALILYRSAKSVQQISDAQVMSTSLRAELDLDSVGGALENRELKKALTMTDEAATIFTAATQITSPVMAKWVSRISQKLTPTQTLLSFIKTWLVLEDMVAAGNPTADDGADVPTLLSRLQTYAAAMDKAPIKLTESRVLQGAIGFYDEKVLAGHTLRCAEKRAAQTAGPDLFATLNAASEPASAPSPGSTLRPGGNGAKPTLESAGTVIISQFTGNLNNYGSDGSSSGPVGPPKSPSNASYASGSFEVESASSAYKETITMPLKEAAPTGQKPPPQKQGSAKSVASAGSPDAASSVAYSENYDDDLFSIGDEQASPKSTARSPPASGTK